MTEKSILLVDDEATILKSISWLLKINKFNVTTAKNGHEALAHLQEKQYDLVITDLVMPQVDGIEVLKQARKRYPDIGVIILTGYAEVSSAVEALKQGADDYLQKPCDIVDLLNKANRSFEKQDLIARLRDRNEKLKSEISARKIIEKELEASRDNLEQKVNERTAELTSTVNKLRAALKTVRSKEEELAEKNRELCDVNAALSVMLKRRDKELGGIRGEIAAETEKLVTPLLKKAQCKLTGTARDYLETAQLNLMHIFSEQSPDSVLKLAHLAPRELQVIHYIRQNKSTKEIADLLGLSPRTVESYRENIREKIGIKNQKKSLKKFITSLH
ncbi:MAG: response regulator [Desulfobulbaceae bacterium]|nr:response regulator [Desulfobulbaceae bacterium]